MKFKKIYSRPHGKLKTEYRGRKNKFLFSIVKTNSDLDGMFYILITDQTNGFTWSSLWGDSRYNENQLENAKEDCLTFALKNKEKRLSRYCGRPMEGGFELKKNIEQSENITNKTEDKTFKFMALKEIIVCGQHLEKFKIFTVKNPTFRGEDSVAFNNVYYRIGIDIVDLDQEVVEIESIALRKIKESMCKLGGVILKITYKGGGARSIIPFEIKGDKILAIQIDGVSESNSPLGVKHFFIDHINILDKDN